MANSASFCSSPDNEILPPTSSRCQTQTITATHNFKVTNFSRLDGMGVGNFVSSSTFRVGGGDWSIHLYPDGWKKTVGKAVSLFLAFLDGPPGTRIKYKLSFLDCEDRVEEEKTGKRRTIRVKCGTHTFGSAGA
ncbi:hypothetical protein EJB05_39681, partial [Eragrostis curvula]